MSAKQLIAKMLKGIGIFEVTRELLIKGGLHVPVPHGHSLLLSAIDARSSGEGGRLEGYVCVEIGSTREQLPGQGSTAELARKCRQYGIRFISVDMDPENTAAAKVTLSEIDSDFRAVNSKGEDFLRGYVGRLDFLYLDAFDIDHGRHSASRRARYQAHLGADITNQACYAMHLACAVEASRLMKIGGEVVFDDAWRDGDGWGGKGYSAMPFLLEHGFVVIRETKNTVWLRRERLLSNS